MRRDVAHGGGSPAGRATTVSAAGVHPGASPTPSWLAPALQAVAARVDQLQPYQLAFILGSLERARVSVPPALIDQVRVALDARGASDA